MKLTEYATFDALGLARLVADRQVTPTELARLAAEAIAIVNPRINAVVETYADRIDTLDEATLGDGPFRGVPFLMKDVFGHEAGRTIEFGSRLCRGMKADVDTMVCTLLKRAGVNVLGRSAAPEYSLTGTTEGALYGNTSTPWRRGFSAGGSTGGGMAAVAAGLVPLAHGSDIAGSIRIPASFCGGVGFKPSRGRITFAPMLDEGGFGMTQNFVQTRTVRDAAAMLDCLAIPQPGDPFVIPRQAMPYATAIEAPAAPLRVGYTTAPLMGVETDGEVRDAVHATARRLADLGHHVEEATVRFDGLAMARAMIDLWFFGFDLRLDGYGKRTGRTPGPDTLEPMTLKVYDYAKAMKPTQFMAAHAALNVARRQLGDFYSTYDLWLSPTSARVAEPWGNYNLGRADVSVDELPATLLRPVAQYTLPHNIMGTPAISLPLAMHSNGLPIGVQVAGAPARDDVVLQVARALEQAMPWNERRPPLHVSVVS